MLADALPNDVEASRSYAANVLEGLGSRGLTLACAESLTGGLVADAFVSVPGASAVFRGGATCYAVDSKVSVLGVSAARLGETGPVDGEVALQMARGACRVFGADVAVATTGVAGPGPADGHPAGTVWIGYAGALGEGRRCFAFDGNRREVRRAAVCAAVEMVMRALEDSR